MINYVKQSKFITKFRTESGEFKCEKCGQLEPSVKDLKNHIREVHSH